MKYISQGPMLLDVQMHRPHTKTRNFMDALLAFWPGLQVLSGDLKPAVQTHEMLYQVMQMHKFIPEAFTFDFQVKKDIKSQKNDLLAYKFIFRYTGDSITSVPSLSSRHISCIVPPTTIITCKPAKKF